MAEALLSPYVIIKKWFSPFYRPVYENGVNMIKTRYGKLEHMHRNKWYAETPRHFKPSK